MGNGGYKTVNVLFFGAGKKGKYWLEFCKDFGIVPKGILDNNRELSGSLCDGVMIYGPDHLADLYYESIFITCNNESEIYKQLLELGVEEGRIVTGRHDFLNHILYYAMSDIILPEDKGEPVNGFHERKILLDLQNGMVLGGVESWTYELAEKLKKNGYQGIYLTTDASPPTAADDTYPVYTLQYSGIEKETDKIRLCMEMIIENLPCTIICSFPQYTFWSACAAKQLHPDLIRIIAIQHSDDPLYYEAYSLWKEYVDRYIVISSRIENRLSLSGIEKDMMLRLEWKINCKENIDRVWSKRENPIQIGYAGRITTAQKRADLLAALAVKLREKEIDFRMNIAGAGNYSEILQGRIQEEGCRQYVTFMGHIERKNIPEFWSRQDIMVSCSDVEGHSITQSEAMAAGAVPVITDVSGAEDDITDGYNGFIVPAGDIDALADRICYLYQNRNELKLMGMRAHRTIYDRQKNLDLAGFWNGLLREVWQS